MPQSNDAASAGEITAQQPAEATASTATEQKTEQPQTASNSSLMDRLGLPAEVQKELGELPTAETVEEPAVIAGEPPAEVTGEAEQEAPEQESETEAVNDELPKPNKNWPPEVQEEFTRRVGKEARKRRKEGERAEQAEEKAAQLQAQLEGVQPITLVPTGDDLLANVQNDQQLAAVVQEARVVRDWCRKHPNGFIENEGTENQREIPAEEIASKLSRAEDVLMFEVPRKQVEFKQRAEYDGIAKQHYPKLFDKSSEDYQLVNALQMQMPGLVNHPGKHLIFGDYLRGVKARVEEESKAVPNGDLPAALLRKQPPLAPHVPTAPAKANGSEPSHKKIDTAMNQAAQEGSREAIVAALRANREAAATRTDPRSPVLV